MSLSNFKPIAIGTLSMLSLFANSGAYAAEGWGTYLGAGIGAATDKNDSGTFDVTTTAFKVFGGYSFGRYIAVELDYVNAGTAEQRNGAAITTVKSSGLNIYAMGKLPIGDRFFLSAKIGQAFYRVEVDYRAPGAANSSERDEQDLAYGIGAAFNLNKTFGLQADYEAVDIPRSDFNVVSLSGVFKF